jgi:hypothetical protein
MYPSPTSTPSPDAAVVPIGRSIAFSRAAVGTVLVLAAALIVLGLANVVDRRVHVKDPELTLAMGSLLALLCAVIGFACMRYAWRRRGIAISADQAGLWLSDGDAHAVVPWGDVKAIGLHRYVLGKSNNWPSITIHAWNIELRLRGPIDRDDPLLKRMVLPADPPRYMIRLPRGARRDAVAAIESRVPELWREFNR